MQGGGKGNRLYVDGPESVLWCAYLAALTHQDLGHSQLQGFPCLLVCKFREDTTVVLVVIPIFRMGGPRSLLHLGRDSDLILMAWSWDRGLCPEALGAGQSDCSHRARAHRKSLASTLWLFVAVICLFPVYFSFI